MGYRAVKDVMTLLHGRLKSFMRTVQPSQERLNHSALLCMKHSLGSRKWWPNQSGLVDPDSDSPFVIFLSFFLSTFMEWVTSCL